MFDRLRAAWLAAGERVLGGMVREVPRQQTAVRSHLNEHSDQLWYAEARCKGLPIGSGVVESANSPVRRQRMKRNGVRWTLGGAKAMAALRCADRSTGGMDAVNRAAFATAAARPPSLDDELPVSTTRPDLAAQPCTKP